MPNGCGKVTAVIVAAGKGQRLGQDKMLLPLHGKPVLAWTVDAFEACPLVDEIVVVASEANAEAASDLRARLGWKKVARIVLGGPTRHESVRNGLAETAGADWVLIHDGARPFVDDEIIARGLEAARSTGAALAAVPVKDTIKVVGAGRAVLSTPDRETLWAAQTPQVFRRDLLWEAHQKVTTPATDDASLLEQLGHPVLVFLGSYDNLKVTTPEDVELAQLVAARRVTYRGLEANGR
jgi:2-C-methyl-D-erythritol 4-phosphate cytidylyltransferase